MARCPYPRAELLELGRKESIDFKRHARPQNHADCPPRLAEGFVPHIWPHEQSEQRERWSEWQDLNLRQPIDTATCHPDKRLPIGPSGPRWRRSLLTKAFGQEASRHQRRLGGCSGGWAASKRTPWPRRASWPGHTRALSAGLGCAEVASRNKTKLSPPGLYELPAATGFAGLVARASALPSRLHFALAPSCIGPSDMPRASGCSLSWKPSHPSILYRFHIRMI
jgi:hypothetical protein